jgi:hypothetical protein
MASPVIAGQDALPLLEDGSRQCRYCLDEEPAEDLIAPCRCAGSGRWVHRRCLDEWRARERQRRAFTHCEVCNFEYVVEVHPEDEAEEERRRCRFRALIVRDSLLAFLAVQAAILVLAFLIKARRRGRSRSLPLSPSHPRAHTHARTQLMDTHGNLRDSFPSWLSQHGRTTYYIMGVLCFVFLAGLYGCVSEREELRNRPDPFRECCRYGCDLTGLTADGFLACVIITVVAFVLLLGLYVVFTAASIFVQRVVQKHMRVVWLREQGESLRGEARRAWPLTRALAQPSATAWSTGASGSCRPSPPRRTRDSCSTSTRRRRTTSAAAPPPPPPPPLPRRGHRATRRASGWWWSGRAPATPTPKVSIEASCARATATESTRERPSRRGLGQRRRRRRRGGGGLRCGGRRLLLLLLL